MSCALDDPPPAEPLLPAGWQDLLTRIAEETELDGTVRLAGEPLTVPSRCRLAAAALADALHARYFPFPADAQGPVRRAPGRSGTDACIRLVEALRPRFLGRDGWTLSYRTENGAPVLAVIAGGGPQRPAASCFLDLVPGIAPEAFARLVTTLDGYGLGFSGELRGTPAAPERVTAGIITVARRDLPTVARAALRMRERSPLLFGRSVAAFTRPVAGGIGIADEPEDGARFGRQRFGLVAAALLAAGPGAGPAERRAAVLRGLDDAGLDPDALHLDPGKPEFEL